MMARCDFSIPTVIPIHEAFAKSRWFAVIWANSYGYQTCTQKKQLSSSCVFGFDCVVVE